MAKTTFTYKNSHCELFYNIYNTKKQETILFLHGWGSNKEVMEVAFKEQLLEYKLLFVDMPGFGKSTIDLPLNTQDYKNMMQLFLEILKLEVTAIVGHSFGGKVATLMNPKNLILLSSAGIIETKSTKTLLTIRMAKVFNKFGLSKVTKLLRSKDVNMMSENMYETFKNVVDEDFSKSFEDFKNKAYIFWGEQDVATSLKSGQKIHSLIKDSTFKSYPSDHYFFLKFAEDISKTINSKL